jgi:hypothetical protein
MQTKVLLPGLRVLNTGPQHQPQIGPYGRGLRITDRKITMRPGGVAQVIEDLPSKREVLSSNHSIAKKRKKNH